MRIWPPRRRRRQQVIEISDRYSATGTPYPDPETMCQGKCEGMGCVPVYDRRGDPDFGKEPGRIYPDDKIDRDPRFVALWEAAEAKSPADDGWHFVVCPDCNGTRLRPGAPVPEGWPEPVHDHPGATQA